MSNHSAIQRCATEWSYASGKAYADPFNEVTLDVHFTDPTGASQLVPAFWAGDQTWTVRFAPAEAGTYRFQTICSDATNQDLHGQEGRLTVTPYAGRNPLLQHGPLRLSASRRSLEHADGTPFFWLADTWWMGLCQRLSWPEDFHALLADRVRKGFSVVQIVAGLYPDMPAFDERGANEAGFPWEPDYARINPAYFDAADLRIQALVAAGVVPCIVACWGYFVRWMGVNKLKQHWRNLVARYSAYPVVWCLAGEAAMPFYLSEDRDADGRFQRQSWTELAAYLRELDPAHHPITIHPTSPASARDQLLEWSALDIDMLQTGHSDRDSLESTVQTVLRSVSQAPALPTINGEVCYEGILEASREEIQRQLFWSCVLSGAAGHTYGANGIWQVNGRDTPYGPSPHGFSWGDLPWEEAARLPGSGQLGLAKQLITRYPWWRFEPHPEWVEPHWSPADYSQSFTAGIPGEVRVSYFPWKTGFHWRRAGGYRAVGLEPGVYYGATFVDPTDGKEYPAGSVTPDASGSWQIPHPPIMRDWVLVLQA